MADNQETTVTVNGQQMTESDKNKVEVKSNEKLVETKPGEFKTLTRMRG